MSEREVVTYTAVRPGVCKLTFAWERPVGEHLFEATVIRQEAGQQALEPERNQFLDTDSLEGVFDMIKGLKKGAEV
jgi:hypothetical protein